MLRYYFTIAFRSLQRNKLHSVINVAGLSLGMAIAMLIGCWISDEISFDRSFINHGRIAQVMQHVNFDGNVSTATAAPIPLATQLRQDYKNELRYTILSTFTEKHTLAHGDKKLSGSGNFMQAEAPAMLTLRMLQGNRNGLQDPSSILVSASLAKTIFGNRDPMNQLVTIDDKLQVTITGVYEDFANNSSFRDVDFIAPWDLYATTLEKGTTTFWMNNSWQIFIQLSPGVDLATVSKRMEKMVMGHLPPPPPGQSTASFSVSVFLHPMDRWHLYSGFTNGRNTGGRIEQVWMFGTIGLFILLLACINFMNLSTAKSDKRAKEVGILKTLGSRRWQLIQQFFSESLSLTFIAGLLALVLLQLSLPFFNEVTGKQISIPWHNILFWSAAMAVCLLTAFIAGSYPAFYLSSFEPIKVLKGRLRSAWVANLPRKVLVVVQFSVSVILIIGTIMVFRQVQYTKERPVGYNPDGLLQVDVKTPLIHQHFDAIRHDLLAAGAITDIAEAGSPLTDVRANYGGLDWKGKDPNMHDDFGYVPVSPGFGKTAGWTIVKGRDFQENFPGDSTGMILNEAAVAYMGLKEPIGEMIRWDKNYTIIGVIKNMVMTSPYEPVKPMVFCPLNNAGTTIHLRLHPMMRGSKAIANITATFKRYDPAGVFDYQFTHAEYARKFGDEERTGTLAGIFSLFAIFISCIGLFGMASFMAEQRIKEIAVRKVLGASIFGLWAFLSREFMNLILIALGIAMPAAYFLMHEWLQQFTYRTALVWWIFVAAACGSILVTLLTVSYQTIRSALINPAKSLRTD